MSGNLYTLKQLATLYAKYRPRYTDDVARYVINYLLGKSPDAEVGKKLGLMVEVGCGTGQATGVFAPYFEKVIATDISDAQVRHAADNNAFGHVTYVVGTAEDMRFGDQTVDLVLSALSAHWFDLPKFLDEAKRVLKPGGCLAVIGNFLEDLRPIDKLGAAEINWGDVFEEQLLSFDVNGNSWRIKDANAKYSKVYDAIPWPDKRRFDKFKVRKKWSLGDVQGFEETMGLYQNYVRHHADVLKGRDISVMGIERLKSKVKRLLQLDDGVQDDEVFLDAVFNEFVIVARPS